MAARKSTNKKGTVPATKESEPPKTQTWKAHFNRYGRNDLELFTNSVSAEDAFVKFLTTYRGRYPSVKITSISVGVSEDITFVP